MHGIQRVNLREVDIVNSFAHLQIKQKFVQMMSKGGNDRHDNMS